MSCYIVKIPATGVLKPGSRSPPVNVSADVSDRGPAIGAVDRDGLRLRIDDPNGRTAGSQPILHLGNHVAGPIVRRNHFDRQIRRTGKIALRQTQPPSGSRK